MDYGPKFDQELEKLLWEFLIRLDQLLPVPSLAQVVGASSPPDASPTTVSPSSRYTVQSSVKSQLTTLVSWKFPPARTI